MRFENAGVADRLLSVRGNRAGAGCFSSPGVENVSGVHDECKNDSPVEAAEIRRTSHAMALLDRRFLSP